MLLGALWELAATSRLPPGLGRQIEALAELIEDERRETEVDTTPRYRLVALFRRGFKSFMSTDDVLKNAVAMKIIVDTLTRIDWTTLAKLLPG